MTEAAAGYVIHCMLIDISKRCLLTNPDGGSYPRRWHLTAGMEQLLQAYLDHEFKLQPRNLRDQRRLGQQELAFDAVDFSWD